MFDTGCARLVRLLASVFLLARAVHAEDLPPLLDAGEQAAVLDALRCLKMTPADLRYKKDYAESPFRLEQVQRCLDRPRELPRQADLAIRELAKIQTLRDLVWFGGRELGQTPLDGGSVLPEPLVTQEATDAIPPALREPVLRLVRCMETVVPCLEKAFPGSLSAEARRRAVARYAVENFRLEEDPAERAELIQCGVPGDMLQTMIRRDEELLTEDDAYAVDLLTVLPQCDFKELTTAAARLAEETDAAVRALRTLNPGVIPADARIRIETRLGPIVIGGAGPTQYTAEDNNALVLLDLGGDDTYDCRVGAANGLIGRPISLCIDLAGNDTYRGGTLTQGAGLFGVGVLIDCAGDDVYEGRHLCQGAGLYGVGLLADRGGNDSYTGDIHAQGAGVFGLGLLSDASGGDHYVSRECSQGYGYTAGLGLLLDGSGNDTYFAGGKYSDHERLPAHFLSLSQGFGNGMRSDASGGIGILCDLAGDDTYVCDMFGQGAGYWYSLGMLLDAGGDDLYRCYQYGQGAGIHLSCGILADWQGNDSYLGGNIVQGTGHDWSVGMLFDKDGNDAYVAKSTAQGSALYNSTAWLVDSAGNDTYTAPKGSNTQAAGHDGWTREYGTIALLLDLAGQDQYTNGPRDGYIALKPLHGCALDRNPERGRDARAPIPDPFNGEDGRRAETPSLFTNRMPFASSPTAISTPQNDRERRWLHLIREASQYEDTERRAKDKYLAYAVLQKEAKQALPFWLRQCDHDTGSARFRLEELVDWMGATNAAPALIDALQNPNERVRKNAAYFIGKLEVPGAVDLLLQQLTDDKTRAVALWALGQVKAPQGFSEALRYRNDTNEVVRIRATGVLKKLRDPRAVPELIQSLDDPLWDVRYSAQEALIQIGKPSVPPMLAALDGASDRARPYLIEALGRVGDGRAADRLRPFLRSENWLDRGTAVAAISRLNPAWKRAEFRRLRRADPNEFVQSRLADAANAF